jgi:FHS family L-fucose permease-like MFS transporter
MTKKNKTFIALVLVTSLFFIWGFALNLNPILIKHLKKACQLSNFQSSLVDSASYTAYFLLAIPAARFMKRFGYKGGIILGLLLFSIGAILFYPASIVRSYPFFLAALFVLFSGAAFLETAANPYITCLGDPETSTQRINFSQSFNGLAASLAPLAGGIFILSGKDFTKEQYAKMSPQQINTYLSGEASAVQIPYLIIGVVVLIVVYFIYKAHLPEIHEEDVESPGEKKKSLAAQILSLLALRQVRTGVIAQFFYVGAQAGIWGFFIQMCGKVAGLGEKPASFYLTVATFCFMLGRFSGSYLMKFINPVKLLATYAVINVFLVMLAVVLHGKLPVYALISSSFFMSIMFPTIFSLSVRGLGSRTKLGSSLVIMAIFGGAVLPPVMGRVFDLTNIQYAYLVPIVSFLYIFYFAYKNLRVKKLEMVAAH